MKQLIIFLAAIVLLLVVDFTFSTFSDKTTELKHNLEIYKEKYQHAEKEITKLHEKLALVEEDYKFLLENQLKQNFRSVDEIGGELYHAMVHGDFAKMERLIENNIKVFSNHFEITLDGKTSNYFFQRDMGSGTASHLSNTP